MCLRMTTLSHLELVSGSIDGSSSSQSANLLNSISPTFCSNHDSDPPVQLLRLLDHLLEILLTALWRRLLLALVGEVCCLHSHFSHRSLDSKSEVRVVEHLNRKVDRFRSKIHNQRIALELSLVVFVHLDSRFTA